MRISHPPIGGSRVRQAALRFVDHLWPERNVMPSEVEFQSGGETVRAHLYLPEGDGPHPVVVMAGGWCYVRELVQPVYAEAFAAKGVAALVFDYRRLGASDGQPRQHIDPHDQLEDYRNAITWVSDRDDIDGDEVSV